MLKKKSVNIASIFLGICLVIIAVLIKDHVSKTISGLCLGLGAGIFGMGLGNYLTLLIESKNPQLSKLKEIEVNDERNKAIKYHSKAIAGDVLQWIIIVFAFLTILMGYDLWITLLLVGTFMLYNIIHIIMMYKLQNEM